MMTASTVEETRQLESDFHRAAVEVGIKESDREAIASMLAPLRDKNEVTHAHYQHSLRVALVARAIARYAYKDQKALLFAGALHDVGKALVPKEILGKTGGYSESDYRVIGKHVMDSYRMIRDRFDFAAEIILWHHKFQTRAYPKKIPQRLHEYSERTKLSIIECGRLLALADVYDALHRPNSKFKEGGLSGEEIRQKMLELNPDKVLLVRALYESKVLKV
jgi:putative nucleotidyltransferase with HDIG domain